MKTSNQVKFGMFFIVGILLMVSVSAYMRTSNIQYAQFDSGQGGSWKPDRDMCEAGQDFVVQIAPFGCTPAVVRADLLEEQNVPVFCQLAATKINPLIEVDAIESMRFSGEYPKEVSGIGFHPARAALGVDSDLNSPILNNIGYAVIVLKKQENASAMPEFVEGTLTADIRYDIKNAFGIGKASFYLPEMSDDDWDDKKVQYSFWNGKGYLRAEGIEEEGARISVYDDTRKIASVDLDKGKTSRMIYLPGFDCLAGLKLKLDGLEAPDTRAKLEINGEIVEVAEGEKFLENRCWIKKIDKKGLMQEVEVYCKGDEERGSFDLRISPKVELEICDRTGKDCVTKDYEVGDILYKDEEVKEGSRRNIFLGYIGEKKDGRVFIIPAITTAKNKQAFLDSVDMGVIEKFAKMEENLIKDATFIDGLKYEFAIYGVIMNALIRGSDFGGPIFLGTEKKPVKFPVGEFIEPFLRAKKFWTFERDWDVLTYTKKNVKFNGFAGAGDKELDGDNKKYYDLAIEDYDTIFESFSSERFQDGMNRISYGEEALYQKILLAEKIGQKKTMLELCKEFRKNYPDSKKNLKTQCDSEYKLSSSEIASRDVSINGIVKSISLEDINEPKFEDYGAVIRVAGTEDRKFDGSYELEKNERVILSDGEWFELRKVDDNYIEIYANVKHRGLKEGVIGIKKETYKIKLNSYENLGENNQYEIKLTKINLKKSAKVSVIPNIDNAGTEANFSFKIGIEQRAIKLSPEKTREKIEELNKTIEGWEEKSEQLGKVVKGLKTACLGVGAYLTVKNFFADTGGKAIARQEVMKEINLMCADAINGGGDWRDRGYETLDECFVEESKYIDVRVSVEYSAQQEVDKIMDDAQKEVGSTGNKWFGEEIYDESKIADEVRSDVQGDLNKIREIKNPENSEESIKLGKDSTIYQAFSEEKEKNKYVYLNDIREIKKDILIYKGEVSGVTQDDKDKAEVRLYQKLSDIQKTSQSNVERTNLIGELNQGGLKNLGVTSYGDEKAIEGTYSGGSITSEQISGVTLEARDKEGKKIDYPVEVITYNSIKYVAILGGATGTSYVADKIYEYEGVENGVLQVGKEREDIVSKFKSFTKYDTSTYQNQYKSSIGETIPCLRYYETEPYKGLPAVVPFDLKEGWYAWVGQTLPIFGGIKSYEASGRVTSFWVCNVGPNKMEENKGGDDICQMINTGTGQPYDVFPGLDEKDAPRIIREAKDAVERASKLYKSASQGKEVDLGKNARRVKVCKPAVDVPEMQCQSFMSPKDCQLLFNVCDPVVCPSSRCNFGGTYHVKDVIQSGIIGSIALCLPNVREGIYIPVCLTGIKAGIDGLLSVYTSYRDCLQESLDTGKMVGICDEIYSIHLCEFFWRQSLPLAKIIIPKMMEIALGQNVRGGGEYLGVATAWANAEKSIDYFAQYYAASSYQAFKARIVEGVGDAVCQSSISASYPEGGNLLDSLTEPDSPPQFHGRFDEIPFTTATSPPISHYKVFYHIYSGKESRAYYRVYLKSPAGTSFYQDNPIRNVASGYITTGGYATETKDFTAPSGYKELCIMVNNQEECGFKQVSTSYAVNYVNDKYMEEQTSERDVKSEKECIGGSVSAYSLLSPSLEGAADEMINPAIYNRGIIRICATESPGKGTDGAWDGEGARWIQVGNCGSENIKCWLDKESVENVIKHTDIEEGVLEEHAKSQLDLLKDEGGYFGEGVFNTLVEKVREWIKTKKFGEVVNEISEGVMKKAFLNKEKAELLLLRGNAYSGLAGELESVARKLETKRIPIVVSEDEEEKVDAREGEIDKEIGEENCQQVIGEKIMKIAESKKTNDEMFSTKLVKENTGAENFECLVLQLAMQESGLQHCEKGKEGDSCLDCDNDFDDVLKGDDDKSIGIMQLSDEYFDKKKSVNFKWNVEEGIKHLIGFYNINKKSYGCNGENYDSWKRALRHYNGWGCNELTKYYVEEVIGERDKSNGENTKEELVKLFPECGEEETTLETGDNLSPYGASTDTENQED